MPLSSPANRRPTAPLGAQPTHPGVRAVAWRVLPLLPAPPRGFAGRPANPTAARAATVRRGLLAPALQFAGSGSRTPRIRNVGLFTMPTTSDDQR